MRQICECIAGFQEVRLTRVAVDPEREYLVVVFPILSYGLDCAVYVMDAM
jgi:hypothetical protein